MGEFNRCEPNTSTNFQTAIRKLRDAGFSKEYADNFKIILWDIPNGYYGKPETKFEDFADAPNFFYLSGFDGSLVSFLLEGKECNITPKNAEELMEIALNQELLNRVRIL